MPNLAQNIEDLEHGDQLGIPNEPIDFSIQYKSRVRGASRHFGFLQFFAKKPWPVVQAYISHFSSPGELIGDAFAGSGVTPVEALVLGRRAVATDINPVARFITRMTAIAPVDIEEFRLAFQHVSKQVRYPIEELKSMADTQVSALLATLEYPRTPIPATVRRAGAATVDQLHTSKQLAGLALLRDAIGEVSSATARDLLLAAFARTLKFTNKTYIVPKATEDGKRRTPYRGDAGIFRRNSYSLASPESFYEHDVWDAFERAFENVVKVKRETNHLIGNRYNPANFCLGDLPASRFHELSGEETVDYFFTDPPYSNAIHFIDLSVMWAAWLGFELTDQISEDELIISGVKKKSKAQFIQEFGAATESIARALKRERWFTLVYKHRDLSLWQSIVSACEQSGLQYVNAVWQDLNIASTRQIESPDINPSGDMYLNFRKISRSRFQQIYPRAAVLDIPTTPTYVEKEIERLVVTYLGADTNIITAGVIQQILDSRAFRNYTENPANLSQDIKTSLSKGRFTTWKPGLWIMKEGEPVDSSIWPIDRARYYVFEFLKHHNECTDGEVNTHLLTRFSREHAETTETVNIDVRTLLRHIASEIAPHRWRFDEDRVTKYKQLRLFFQRSKADEIREKIEEREGRREYEFSLHPDFEGIGLLLDRLAFANKENSGFEGQARELLVVLNSLLYSLTSYRDDLIEEVWAIGDWADLGIDLRNAAFEDLIVQIILVRNERTSDLYREISDKVFGSLDDGDLLLQFELVTSNEWQDKARFASRRGTDLGVRLLGRR